MRFVAVISLLFLAALTACGNGSSAGDAYREDAQRAVQYAVLTLDNLPEGWASSEIGAQALSGLSLSGDSEASFGR